MSQPALTLVPPQPEPKQPSLDLGKIRRNRVSLALENAFADALEELGFEEAIEVLGAQCEDIANEAKHWNRDIWMARSAALMDVSNNEELR